MADMDLVDVDSNPSESATAAVGSIPKSSHVSTAMPATQNQEYFRDSVPPRSENSVVTKLKNNDDNTTPLIVNLRLYRKLVDRLRNSIRYVTSSRSSSQVDFEVVSVVQNVRRSKGTCITTVCGDREIDDLFQDMVPYGAVTVRELTYVEYSTYKLALINWLKPAWSEGNKIEVVIAGISDTQVTYGFHGCISDVKLGGVALPLEEGSTTADGRVQLARRVRVRVASACPALPPPTPCASYPCLNGGTCRDAPDLLEDDSEGYTCICHARFLGPRCELDTDPCASAPCLHGGSCAASARGWRCACAAGLAGERCERGRWCAPGVCAHGGACEEGEWGPSCRCRGYYGPRCQYDVDECAGEPCLNGATCFNEPGSFRCICPPDKTGMNCGNPLYSDAVVAGGAGEGPSRALRDAWRWACEARWPLAAACAALILLLLLLVVPVALRRRAASRAKPSKDDEPLNSHALEKLAPRSKLSNLEAVRRERPASCAEPPPLNNVDTLRSYGSAGDELEGIPPDYRRNLNIDVIDRKPWSEQMHLQTFVDNKIYNDLKSCKPRIRARSPGVARRPAPGEPHLVGGYHWDCSDWCGGGGALPGISEVAGSERPDSSSAASPPASPLRRRRRPACDSDSALDDDAPPLTDASSYLLHADEYAIRASSDPEPLRARTLRDPDAASLITMLEERNSLLGGDDDGSGSELSANLCEIEESDAEEAAGAEPRHTDV